MKLGELITHLKNLEDQLGGEIEVDILTETPETGQVEQSLDDIAVGGGRVKLLPPGF